MTAPASDLLRKVWEFPLFEALYARRSRRFGLGFAMNGGPWSYRSQQAPLPLNDLEEALLVAAGVGFSGLALWDQSRPLPYRAGDGRTFPSTSRGRRTALFFTNDRGVHVIDPAAASASKLREVDGIDEQDKVLALYRRHRRELRQGRLEIPRRVPPLSGHNLWNSNMPGSTLFMPVCDVSFSLIGLIAQFVDPRLERFAAKDGRGMHVVDDRHGFRPAGTERWVRNGFLDRDNVLPLSHLERQACYFMFSEPAVICQNVFLATEAMGIGGWMHCGFLSREVFEALGFTTVVPNGVSALANPVGLDGIFQAYCLPYFPSMDAAVDAVLAPMLRKSAAWAEVGQAGAVPYRMSGAEHREGTVEISAEGIACTKAICNYIFDTYGRFPGGVDAMHLMWFFQAHHLDTDYYDRFFRAGAYGPTHAAHMATWHA
jgi:nitroreductase